jgi:hypothetical protein
MWLRQEDILQPRDLLTDQTRRRLIEEVVREDDAREDAKPARLYLPRVKASEFKYALVAEAWRPYFDLMHDEHKRAWEGRQPSDTRSESQILTDLGFDSTAVNAAVASSGGLIASREAACRFAAGSLGVDEDTVQVAHSKVYPSPGTRVSRREREAARRAASKKPPSS